MSQQKTIMAITNIPEICNALTDLFRTPTFTSYYVKETNSGMLDYRGTYTTALMWNYKHPIRGNFL